MNHSAAALSTRPQLLDVDDAAVMSIRPENLETDRDVRVVTLVALAERSMRTIEVEPEPASYPTVTATAEASLTPTGTPTVTLTPTPDPTSSPPPSPTATLSPTGSPTASPSRTATLSPTLSPTFSQTPTSSPSYSPTISPTLTPTMTATFTPSPPPTDTATATPTNSFTATPTDTFTSPPTTTPTQSPTNTMTRTPTGTPTPNPTDTLTPPPTETMPSTPTEPPTQIPTQTPTTSALPAPVVAAEPPCTAGLENEISWTDASTPPAEFYWAECATDSDFLDLVQVSSWIQITKCLFTDLDDGITYYYRVKSRYRNGAQSAWSNVVFSKQDNTDPVVWFGGYWSSYLTVDEPSTLSIMAFIPPSEPVTVELLYDGLHTGVFLQGDGGDITGEGLYSLQLEATPTFPFVYRRISLEVNDCAGNRSQMMWPYMEVK